MDPHTGSNSRGTKAPCNHRGPHVEVVLRVAHNRGLARSTRGRVDAGDSLGGHREHAEGVVLAKIFFGRERQSLQVIERADVVWAYSRRVEFGPIGLNIVIGMPHTPLQTTQLEFREFT